MYYSLPLVYISETPTLFRVPGSWGDEILNTPPSLRDETETIVARFGVRRDAREAFERPLVVALRRPDDRYGDNAVREGFSASDERSQGWAKAENICDVSLFVTD